MLAAFTLLLLCQLLGEASVRGLGLPVPGPVAGMVLLFVGLVLRGEVPVGLDRVATALLGHLSLLFVPAGVGVVAFVAVIERAAVPLLLALLPGTLIALLVTGWTMAWLIRRR